MRMLWFRRMGQIVIDIPTRKTRRYVLSNVAEAEALLETLEDSAVRLRNNRAKLTRQQMEDIRDGQSADRVVAEYERTGVSYTVDDLRKKFGL